MWLFLSLIKLTAIKFIFSIFIVINRFTSVTSAAPDFSEILKSENLNENIQILTTDLLYKSNPGHCYTFITDQMYESILDIQLFRLIKPTSYLIIKVEDYVDMTAPTERGILTSLMEAKKSGCQTYLIYLANGIQIERFLQFIDKFRVLDTRSQFIILHDYRLFVSKLHYIWKRLINVIFVKQIDDSFRGNVSTGTWFQLSTVPFPLPIREVYVAKQVDIWRSGKYSKGTKLFYDKTVNLKGEPLKAIVLKHTPAVSSSGMDRENNATTYSGVEIEIINGVSQALNFTIDFYESTDSDTEKWGRNLTNGTTTGLLGEKIDGQADFALADLHHTAYHLERMDLSIPYTTQCMTFITPESLTDNSWQTLILPFSLEMWIGVLFFLFCVGIVFYAMGQIHLKLKRMEAVYHSRQQKDLTTADPKNLPKTSATIRKYGSATMMNNKNESISIKIKIIPKKQRIIIHKDIFESFGNCILYTYSMLLVVSLPRLPQSWSIRLLTGWYWVYCILVVVAYRASLTAILANPAPKVTIDKLKELAHSSIGCGVWGEQNKKFFTKSLDETGQMIGAKMEDINDVANAIEMVAEGKFAYYENEYFLRQIRSKRDTEVDEHTLHIMKECAIHMPISIGLEKNSPLKKRFDKLLRRIIESGLASKWLSDAVHSFEASMESDPQEALMDLKKLYGAFVALGIGYLISILALLGEIIYWKCVVVRSPMYDKYALYKLYRSEK